jgi:hypothetical protein
MPVLLKMLPRVCYDGLVPASLYEVNIAPDRPAIVDDRNIKGEIAKPKVIDVEQAAYRKLGLG